MCRSSGAGSRCVESDTREMRTAGIFYEHFDRTFFHLQVLCVLKLPLALALYSK